MVEKGYLPKDRAEGCGEEFHQVAYEVKKLIDPSVDAELRRASRRPQGALGSAAEAAAQSTEAPPR